MMHARLVTQVDEAGTEIIIFLERLRSCVHRFMYVYRLDFEATATNDLTDMKLLLPLGIRTLGDHLLVIDRLTFQYGMRLIAFARVSKSLLQRTQVCIHIYTSSGQSWTAPSSTSHTNHRTQQHIYEINLDR
jgi:hypothetical protein